MIKYNGLRLEVGKIFTNGVLMRRLGARSQSTVSKSDAYKIIAGKNPYWAPPSPPLEIGRGIVTRLLWYTGFGEICVELIMRESDRRYGYCWLNLFKPHGGLNAIHV